MCLFGALGFFAVNSVSADVRIGFLGGFTGPVESLAPSIFAGAELAAKHVNDQGGLLGGQRMNMPDGDSGCDNVTAATKSAQHLVEEERVIAIVGALCSGATVAAAKEVAIKNKVLMVSPASTSPTLTTLNDDDLVFRTVPSDAYQADVLARLILAKGIKRIAISFADNDYGKGFFAALQEAYRREGGRVSGR